MFRRGGIRSEVKSTGEHADKTIAQIKKEMEALKGKKPFNREQFLELMFALRAKQGWKKEKEQLEHQKVLKNKSELKELVKEELSKIQENKALTVEESYYKFSDGVYGLLNMELTMVVMIKINSLKRLSVPQKIVDGFRNAFE